MPVVAQTDDEGNGDNSNFMNNSAQNFSNPRSKNRDNVNGPLSPASRHSHRSELPNMASSSKPQALRYTMSNFEKLGKKDGLALQGSREGSRHSAHRAAPQDQ